MAFSKNGAAKIGSEISVPFPIFFANPESIKRDDFSPVPAHLFLFGGGDIGV